MSEQLSVPPWHKLVLSAGEAAELVGRARQDVAALCELGLIPGARQDGPRGRWRIPRRGLDQWIDAGQPMGVAS